MRPPSAGTTSADGRRRPAATARIAAVLVLGLGLASWAAAGPADWTVLAYLSGDGSLEAAAVRYLHTLAKAPPGQAVAIAAQLDRGRSPSAKACGAAGATRWLVASRPGARERELVDLGWHHEVNMGDPESLCDFARWAVERYPAKRYLLLIMGHGNGVRALSADEESIPSSGVAYDATCDDCLTTAELGQACARIRALVGGRLSILAIDACFSATMELGCQVAPSVECLTGSPGLIYEPGVPWDHILGRLTAAPDMSAPEAAKLVVESVRERQERGGTPQGAYLAADLTRAPELEAAVGQLSGALVSRMDDLAPLITLGRSEARTTGLHAEMVDLSEFLRGLARAATSAGETRVAQLAGQAAGIADGMVLARFAADGNGGSGRLGWAVFFPPSLTAFPADYLDTGRYAREAGWGTLVAGYLGRLRSLVTPTAQDARPAGA